MPQVGRFLFMPDMKSDVIKWTATQRRFIEWIATPDDLKEVRRYDDFAVKLGVSAVTLWRWKKLPGFWQEVQNETRRFLGDAIPEALQALKHEARRGNFNHLKLYLEMAGLYVQKIAPTNPEGTQEYGALDDTAINREIATIVDSARARAPKRAAARTSLQVDNPRKE